MKVVSLLDIAPQTVHVPISEQEQVPVYGVSASGFTTLLARFPDLLKLFGGGEVDTNKLMSLGGEIIGAIIAAGLGHPGNADAEEIAGRFSVNIQADLLGAILKLTMPQGVQPFLDKLTTLGSILNSPSAPAPVTLAALAQRSRKRSRS